MTDIIKRIKNVNRVVPFLGRYKEIQITYDFETLSTEVDGLTPDGFWESILVQSDLNDPQSYGHGVYDTIIKLYPSIPISLLPEQHVSDEGYVIS